MIKLNDAMKEFMGTNLAYFSTVDKDGNPNIGPKRSARVINDSQIMFNENTGGQTVSNLKDNGKVSVAYVNWATLKGYRFNGKAEVFYDGENYEIACNWAKENKMGKPKAAVIITLEKAFLLDSGAKAGTPIE